jgi:hypothetical protein
MPVDCGNHRLPPGGVGADQRPVTSRLRAGGECLNVMFYSHDFYKLHIVILKFNFCLLGLNIYNPEQAGLESL